MSFVVVVVFYIYVFNVFIYIFLPGRGFSPRMLSFYFSLFESPPGRAWARFCVPSRLSGATRDPFVVLSSSLGVHFRRPGAEKQSQK